MRGGFENFVGLRGVREFVVGVEDSARSLGSDDVTVLCIECDKDNFHMIFKAKSTLNIPKYLNAIKTITSREIKRKFPEVKKKLWKSMFWSRSYFLATTGQVTLDVLKNMLNLKARSDDNLQIQIISN